MVAMRRFVRCIDPADQTKIVQAMNTLMFAVGTPIANSQNRQNCVFFRPRQASDPVYIRIQYGQGCSAHVGYVTRPQSTLTLNKAGCFQSKTIQHELLHILGQLICFGCCDRGESEKKTTLFCVGFNHEQSRPDRDQYLQVNLENVQSGKV
jgi:hypothetical protein